MASQNTVNIKIKTTHGTAIQSLKQVGNQAQNTGNKFAKFYSNQKKVNTGFSNITKDANRASTGLKTLGSSLGGLSAKTAFSVAKFYLLGQAIGKAINASMDMVETSNLFYVALGNMADETDNVVDSMHNLLGLDTTNLQNTIGTYALLSRSMGMNENQASMLSTTMAKLATDYASLTNIDVAQVMGDLKSGLVGQSETVYKYGLDVTEAGIKAEAMAEGISKSVRNMTQGEKMLLRYNAMIRQSVLAQGDFARTIETPANQLKILQDRVTTLTRSFGTLFIPTLTKVLPYLNAMAIILIEIVDAMALMVGYKAPETEEIGGALDGVKDDADSATESVDELKKSIQGFDQLNILSDKSTASTDTSTILDTSKLLTYDNLMEGVRQKSQDIADAMRLALDNLDFSKILDALGLLNPELKKLSEFTFEALQDFYDKFLVPLKDWVVGTGLPKFIEITADLLSKIDWEALKTKLGDLWDQLEPFVENVGEGLLWFYENVLSPLLQQVVNEGLTTFIQALTDLLTAINAFSDSEEGTGALTSILNFAKSFGSINIDGITEWFTALSLVFTSITDFIKDPSLEKLGTILTNIRDAFLESPFSPTESPLVKLIEALTGFDLGEWFRTKVMPWLDGTKWAELGTGIKEAVIGWATNIILWFGDPSTSMKTKGKQIVSAIKNGILEKMVKFKEWLSKLPEKIGKAIGTLTAIGINIGYTLVEGIKEGWEEKQKLFKEWLSELPEEIRLAIGNLIFIGKKFIPDIINGMKTHWLLQKPAFNIWLKTLPTKIATAIRDNIVDMVQAGADLMAGFIEGLKSVGLPVIEIGLKAKKTTFLGKEITVPDLDVSWNAVGGIFDSASVIGVGEDGKEAVVPLEKNTQWIDGLASDIISKGGTGGSISKEDIKTAFKEAIKESNFGDTVLYLGDEQVARATNKGNKILNRRYNLSTT